MIDEKIPGRLTRFARRSSQSRWRKFSGRALEVLFFVVLIMGFSAYQARNLLATDRQPAPGLVAETLQGERYDIAESDNRPALIYFFAPWCPYCSASADNLVRLREWRNVDSLEILVVALDWESVQEIQDYAKEHELNVPILLGDATIAGDWKIRGFPTYYVLDDQHRVVSRDFGYSTQLGLWWRSWFAP